MLKRHKILWTIIRVFVIAFTYLKFGYTFKKAKNLPESYIVLSNHTTDFDPLLVATSFKKNIRFVASEHIVRWKHAYKFIKFVFDPIIRYKGTNAASTVKDILRTVRGGTNVCMFAEGSRNWNGKTIPIAPSTGKVIKSSKCALVTYKITGGYFVSPLWSEGGTRRGKISGKVVNVYTAEQLLDMSVDEINEIIKNDLYEDAYETMKQNPTPYKHKKLAVRMESMCFSCPNCKSIDTLKSERNIVTCRQCNNSFSYNEYGELVGIKQSNIKDLFVWLKNTVESDVRNNAVYSSDDVKVITVDRHIECVVHNGSISISTKKISFGEHSILLDDISDMNMHGKNALVFSTKDSYFEIKVLDGTSALKFYMYYLAVINKLDDRFSF